MTEFVSAGQAAARLLVATGQLDEAAAARVLAKLGSEGVEITQPPRTGLVMMSATDPYDTDFHLGEVLVTEAAVSAAGMRGWGMATGDVPQRALLKAMLDLFVRSGDGATLVRLEALLRPEVERAAVEHEREQQLIARTHVRFDLMPGK